MHTKAGEGHGRKARVSPSQRQPDAMGANIWLQLANSYQQLLECVFPYRT